VAILDKKGGSQRVTLGLIDGTVHEGRIKGFLPQLPDITMEAFKAGATDGETSRMLIPAERVAFIAFFLDNEEPPARRASIGRRRLRIHLRKGKTFVVEVDLASASNPLGFYSTPAEEKSPFREIFFYAHGVNAKETDEQLGAMLVQGGVVNSGDIARGLAAQKTGRPMLGQILVEQKVIDAEALEQAAALQQRKRLRLGELLVQAGLITGDVLDKALQEQKKRGGKRIGEILVEMKILTEQDLATTLAGKFHLPFVNLEEYPINISAASEVDSKLIEKYCVLPIDTDSRTLTLAIHDPLAIDMLDAVRAQTKKRVTEVVAIRSQVQHFVTAHLQRGEVGPSEPSEMDAILKELAAEDISGASETSSQAEADNEGNASDSAVIKLVNQIIIDAYRRGASDIHIEPNGNQRTTVVRFRVDGDCVAYQEVPASFRNPLVARLKIMARLDIAERRKPQDGKIRFQLKEQAIELRVATIPTVNQNEDVVLRILAASKPLPLENMALSERNLRELKVLAEKPYGLILCVGPTGSGKTTTLHSLLGQINTIDRKIWTAEDPVEITQHGLRQVQMQPKIGLDFATAMRAFLRADPDVIMVGEMRDEETAGTAIEASLTGHLVVSTLHTNSAPETITRLIDMGLDPFSFADALLGILAQRLVRGLCKECRQQYAGSREEYEEVSHAYAAEDRPKKLGPFGAAFKLWRGVGCEACENSGYKKRLGIHELLVATDPVKRAIQRKSTVDDLRKIALEEGMTTLLQDGVQKAMAGLTDMKQVLAVCSR
jgi:type II secretory ATPase GspE/PulE/Tfp pilus assembly ATPase PilB-like protein